MNPDLTFDFSVDKENKTVTVKREFSAELPLVWEAYTSQEILDQWWAPKPWRAKTKTLDFREGGHWLYAMVGPNGEEHWSRVDYKSIKDQESFSGLDAFTDTEGNVNEEMPRSEWEIKFTSKGDNTLVECFITYPDLSQLEKTMEMGFKDGMRIAMEGLEALLPSFKK